MNCTSLSFELAVLIVQKVIVKGYQKNCLWALTQFDTSRLSGNKFSRSPSAISVKLDFVPSKIGAYASCYKEERFTLQNVKLPCTSITFKVWVTFTCLGITRGAPFPLGLNRSSRLLRQRPGIWEELSIRKAQGVCIMTVSLPE